MLADLVPWAQNLIFPLNRWVHIVACTLLVGGVLFFELVVPLAIEDLKEEQRFTVFGRARFVFRKVAWLSVVALVLSGTVSTWRMWHVYHSDEKVVGMFILGSRPWVIAHIFTGAVGGVFALGVTRTRRILNHPIGWMRAVLVTLLVSMFLASVARQVRLRVSEWRDAADVTRDSSYPISN
jgi:uncharacterized membrane protein